MKNCPQHDVETPIVPAITEIRLTNPNGHFTSVNLDAALAKLKENQMNDREMLNTLQNFFAWAAGMAIEFSRIGTENEDRFKITLAPMLIELRQIFKERGLEREFQDLAEEELRALQTLDRKTPENPIRLSGTSAEEENQRETVEYGQSELPFCVRKEAFKPHSELQESATLFRSDERKQTGTGIRGKMVLIFGGMASIGAIIGSGTVWTTEKIHASATHKPVTGQISRSRTETGPMVKQEFRLAESHALDLYIKNICQAGPPILCEGLQEAKRQTIIEANDYENTDFTIKIRFLAHLETAILQSEKGTEKGKKTALEYVKIQQRHLMEYAAEKKWKTPDSGRLLKEIRSEEKK